MAVPERLIGYDSIQVNSPYELQTLHELEITAKANDHATLRFTGIISDEKKERCVYSATSQDKVEVLQIVGGSVEQILFKGKVQSVTVKAVNGIYYLEVIARSHTIDLDIKYQNRSFQNNRMTYGQLVKAVIADCDGDAIIDRNVESEPLNQFVLQYQETNWEFLKRMASHFGLTLIPDVTADKPKFWFGLPESKGAIVLDDFHYTVKKNISDYSVTSQNYANDLNESDFTYYELESNRVLPIGALVKCWDGEFTVTRAVMAIRGGGLKHLYVLAPAKGIRQNEIINLNLTGVALEGTIKEVVKDQVKVDLQIDGGQTPDDYTLFPYSTFYTAEGNSGWYCMPEKGDSVRLIFPEAQESSGMVIGSIRKNGSSSKKTKDPNVRYIGTNKGKEMKLAPKELLITAKEKGKILVKLDDAKGIEIQSDEIIDLASKKDFTINTDEGLQMTAADGIYLQCGSSSVVLDGEADFKGSLVTVAGMVKTLIGGAPPETIEEEEEEEVQEEEEEENDNKNEGILDAVQLGLDVAGMIPVVGAVADVANAVISACRGDWVGFGLSLLGAIPGIGEAATAAKLGVKAVKAGKGVTKAMKIAKRAKTAGKMMKVSKAVKTAKTLKAADKAGDAAKALKKGKSITKARKVKGAAKGLDEAKTGMKRAKSQFKKARRGKLRTQNGKFSKSNHCLKDPVDVIVGEVLVDKQDFVIHGRIPLDWSRHYGSQNPRIGLCGRGWETPADIRLEFPEDATVLFQDGTGAPMCFPSLPKDQPVQEPLDGGVLRKVDNYYTVRIKEGLTYHFPIPNQAVTETLVESITDESGNIIRFVRDKDGLKEIQDNNGRRVMVVSKDGRIKAMYITAPYQQSILLVEYAYDENNNLVSVYDALKVPYQFAYQGNVLVRHTNRNGVSIYYEYDKYSPEGRCIHTWGDGGIYEGRFVYHDEEKITEVIDAFGTSIFKYDDRYLVVEEINVLGGVTQFEYDAVGRTTAVVDPDGNRTEYSYDQRGNLLKLTRPDGKSVNAVYNEIDKAIAITEPDGAQWKQEWDSRGLLIKQVSPLGAVSYYEYDAYGQPVALIDPIGCRTEFTFDSFGNLIELRDGLKNVTRLSYNMRGDLIEQTDPLGRKTKFEYDKKGRLIKRQFSNGASIICGYDGEDNLVYYKDENGVETRLEYCGINELKRRIQPDGRVVEYQYDCEEHLIALTNQRGEHYEIKRDRLGRIVGEVDYWGQERKYEYTAAGRLLESKDPLGRIIRYHTDPLGRIIEKVLSVAGQQGEAQSETFAYDSNGRLVLCENKDIRIERKFDQDGRLLQERQGDSVVKYNYDPIGNRIARETEIRSGKYIHHQTILYRYDLLGQPVAIEIQGHAPIQLTRNAVGQVTNEVLNADLKRFFGYDERGYLIEQGVLSTEGMLFKQEYEYDLTGNLLSKMDSVFGTDRFKYDPMGRILTHINPERKVKQFLYDPAGDLLKTQVKTDGEQWSREGKLEGTAYQFDQAGNLIERLGENDKTQFVWDANGRLIESLCNGRSTKYAYDPLGRRISKETDGVVEWFYWDGDALLANVSNERRREWVYYPESFEPLAMLCNDQLYFYHNDPNGLPTRLLTAKGSVVWAARYDAWGKVETLAINEVDQPLRLQGQYFDGETGLHYNRFRYYCPEIGSFISQDPLGLEAGENVYWFAPNVFEWIDPLGLQCKSQFNGRRGIKKAEHDLERNGYTVVGREVTMKVNNTRVRADIVARDTRGRTHVFEVKHGNSTLTKGQAKTGVYNMSKPSNTCSDGGGVIRPSQGIKGQFEVATDNRAAVGARGSIHDATFHTLVYK